LVKGGATEKHGIHEYDILSDWWRYKEFETFEQFWLVLWERNIDSASPLRRII